MLRALYDRIMGLAGHRYAVAWMGLVSFIESSIFPIPPDVMLIPMTLAERRKAWRYALVATLASVAGGVLGYGIGWGLFETLGQTILGFYGAMEKFDSFAARYNDYGAWIVLFAGLTPFPYKVITIASGATGLNFGIFLLASIAARALRFYIVCGLIYWFGPPVKEFIERRLGLVTTIFFVSLFGGFVLVKYLF